MCSLSRARFCTTTTALLISLARALIECEVCWTMCMPWLAAWSAWFAAWAAWAAFWATFWAVAVISWTAVATKSIPAICFCTPLFVRTAM
ncbi:hypothetical protein D3C81_1584890 [compost metagenome]